MRLFILDNQDQLVINTVDYVIDAILKYLKQNDTNSKPFCICLSARSKLMRRVLDELVRRHKQGIFSFKRVAIFVTDESVSLDHSSKYSQHYCLWHHLIKYIDVLREHVIMLDGMAQDLVAECHRFDEKIKEYGGLNLVLIESGRQGELARNEPGSSLRSSTRPKTLSMTSLLDLADENFSGNDTITPKVALTIGIETIMKSKEVVVLFSGVRRSKSLEACVEESTCHMWPVSILQRHPGSLVICDDDSTMELRVKTVKYFLGLQKSIAMVQE